jgi:hypothetical protein
MGEALAQLELWTVVLKMANPTLAQHAASSAKKKGCLDRTPDDGRCREMPRPLGQNRDLALHEGRRIVTR